MSDVAPDSNENRSTNGGNVITPLDGEPGIPNVTQVKKDTYSGKGIFAVALLGLSLFAISALWIDRAFFSTRKDMDSKRTADRPTAAAMEPRQLDLTPPPVAKASAPLAPHVPAIVRTAGDEAAEPIGVRRTAQPATGAPKIAPEDAPVVLVSSRPSLPKFTPDGTPRALSAMGTDTSATDDQPLEGTKRNLEGYQRQLQGLLDTLTKTTALASNGPSNGATRPTAAMPSLGGLQSAVTGAATNAGGNLFGGQLQGSSTPRVAAGTLGNRSLTLPKGPPSPARSRPGSSVRPPASRAARSSATSSATTAGCC
jgi:type IV secretion system protein VirB10